jgi:uncharacterized surface protein with fasciclin (FAS1) repeats
VQRQDQRGILGDAEILRRDMHALRLEAADLGHQRMRIDDDAIANDAQLAGAHDAGGEQAQLVGNAVNDERVAGIVTALEAHDDVGALGEPVDNLALALVAPLRSDDDYIRH